MQEIGMGGFGVVYMAEQSEPVRRRVAVKIVKLGMDTKEIIGRFEAERQALALMDHPNIAKVLDAGATASGRPFFVMELVQGERITDYCDKNRLTVRQRLDLFIQVCHAIQHAHQKGIIHRDIKPSNILVSNPEGATTVKVIDFGIAKAMEQRLTDKTVFTVIDRLIGTPAYMSPEQADMSGQDIDTRSDIYSLGVLLYELLVGQTPFDPEALVMNGLASIRHCICDLEPPAPSAKFNHLKEDVAATIAAKRGVNAPQLSKTIRGDLDWIVMKCLEKDRGRRYETANGLAMDVRRHLDDQTVVAGPPSASYRFQKAFLRNKAAFIAAAAIIMILIGATAVSAWQAVRATRAESLARERLGESEAITKFLTRVFSSAAPSRKGRNVTVVEALGDAVTNLNTTLSNQPALRAKLQSTLGSTYNALSLYRDAQPLNESARDYFLSAQGSASPDTLDAMLQLASTYDQVNRNEDALKLRQRVVEIRRDKLGPEDEDTLDAIGALAISYDLTEDHAKALELREELAAIFRRKLGPEDKRTMLALSSLAISYFKTDRLADAAKLQQEIVAYNKKAYGPENTITLRSAYNLAEYYGGLKQYADALQIQSQLQPLLEKVYGPEHMVTMSGLINLASYYEHVGRMGDAIKANEKCYELDLKTRGADNPFTLTAMSNVGLLYERVGRLRDAIRIQTELIPHAVKAFGPNHEQTLWAISNLSDSEDAAGHADEATRLRKQVFDARLQSLGPTNVDTIQAATNLAASYTKSGHPQEAASTLAKVSLVSK
jgi:tetratricopeptide (TPR) repeat protein